MNENIKKEIEKDAAFIEQVEDRIYCESDNIEDSIAEPEWISQMTDVASKYLRRYKVSEIKENHKNYVSSAGLSINWGRMPGGLFPNFDNQVYYFITNESDSESINIENYEKSINELVSEIRGNSYDHGQELRDNHREAPIFRNHYQVTLVNFYIRDSY